MITKYYVIKSTSNDHYYTEDHLTGEDNRWEPGAASAYKFTTYAEAETQADVDGTPYTEFIIEEILIRT
jgi:hypothetical protein